MNNDLIEKRDERTRRRKAVKRKMDSVIGLSYHDKDKKVLSVMTEATMLSDSKARLIDEGYIDNGFVIKKGALQKFLNGENQYVRGWEFDGEHYVQTEVLNLNNDFVGTVNLGHMDFATMPFILGTWTKDDLTLVDTENERQALDVQLHLDEESVFVQELKRQPYDIGVSAEFWVHENVEDTEKLSETLGYYLPVFDEVYIFAYALVGECGNVNSSGLELKGDKTMPKEEINLGIDEIEIEEPTEEAVDEAEDTEEVVTAEEETPTEQDEESEEEVEEEVAEEDEGEEADEVEEADSEDEEDSDEDEDGEEADDAHSEALAIIKALKEENVTLKDRVAKLEEANAELKKSNRKLQKKLKTEKDAKDAFILSAKDIAVELLPNEGRKKTVKEEAVDRSYYNGDGIGEI